MYTHGTYTSHRRAHTLVSTQYYLKMNMHLHRPTNRKATHTDARVVGGREREGERERERERERATAYFNIGLTT